MFFFLFLENRCDLMPFGFFFSHTLEHWGHKTNDSQCGVDITKIYFAAFSPNCLLLLFTVFFFLFNENSASCQLLYACVVCTCSIKGILSRACKSGLFHLKSENKI